MDNVVSLNEFKQKKEEEIKVREIDDIDHLHDICTQVSNEAINMLEEYGLDIDKIEYSPEIIFFFEAFKGLIMKCEDLWHPFQDLAQDFFDAQGITIEQDESGNYRFVLSQQEEPEPEENK